MKRVLSLLLSLLLIIQLVPAFAFATDEPLKYVAIGDSVGSGFGLKGYTPALRDIPLMGVSLQSWHGVDFKWNLRNTNVATFTKDVADRLLEVKTNGEITSLPELYSQNENGEYIANFEIDSSKTLEENRDAFLAQYPVTFSNLGCPGYLLEDFYVSLLNDSFTGQSKYNPDHICSFWATNESIHQVIGGEEALKWAPIMRAEIEQADLITLNVGANDVLFNFKNSVQAKQDNKFMLAVYAAMIGGMLEMYDGIDSISELISTMGGALGALGKDQFDIDTNNLSLSSLLGAMLEGVTLADILECVNMLLPTNVLKAMREGTQMAINPTGEDIDPFVKNGYVDESKGIKREYGYFDAVIDEIKELNPTAKIVIIGAHNPFSNLVTYNGKTQTRAVATATIVKELVEVALSEALGKALPMLDFEKDCEKVSKLAQKVESGKVSVDLKTIDFEKKSLDEIGYDFAAAILGIVLGSCTNIALAEFNSYAKKVADKYNLPYVSSEDYYAPSIALKLHPSIKGHQEIANAITDVIISKVNLSDNLKEANPDLKKEYILGEEITLHIPEDAKNVHLNSLLIWQHGEPLEYTFKAQGGTIKIEADF